MSSSYNKAAIVTGAAGTLGLAFVRMLVGQGYRVAAIDLRGEPLEPLRKELGEDKILPYLLDVGDPQAVETAVRQITASLGAISVLVNNAGILSNAKCVETSPKEWRKVFHVNIDGAFYLAQAVLPIMRSMQYGRIVNIVSLAAKTGGITAGTAYSCSKGALQTLTFSLARETSRQGITVNGIAPAYVKTPMVMEQLTEDQRRELLSSIPVGRFCEPEEVAHTVSFLISPLAGFITGEIIDQNGGLVTD